MVTAAAVYARISSDPTGRRLGVDRQEQLCRDLAERLGWPVAEAYVDNDISAYAGKPRPAYARLLADLAAGARDAVLVVDTDRLTRTPAELEEFIDVADRHRVALANVSGEINLATSDGRFRARIEGAVARQESEKKSERLRRQRDQAAAAGARVGGPRPFGYEPDGVTVRPHEAAAIVDAAERILDGASLRQVCKAWNDAGLTAARGGAWHTSSLVCVLTGPRVAGLRVHRGEIVGDAVWPAILDRGTWEALRVALGDPRRRQRGPKPKSLLAGLLACGRCGTRMSSSRTSKGTRRYTCDLSPGVGGCGRVAVTAPQLEEHVTGLVLAALDSPDLDRAAAGQAADVRAGRRARQAAAAQVITEGEATLEQLARDHYADARISRAQFLAASDAVQARIDAARDELREPVVHLMPADVPAAGLAAAWAERTEDVEWRRRVVAALVDRVDVAPLAPGRQRRWDPDRITVTWQT